MDTTITIQIDGFVVEYNFKENVWSTPEEYIVAASWVTILDRALSYDNSRLLPPDEPDYDPSPLLTSLQRVLKPYGGVIIDDSAYRESLRKAYRKDVTY